jgi:hypothetical protein
MIAPSCAVRAGPIAGAGLPGVIFTSGGLLGWLRKNQNTVAIAA